MTTKQAVAVVRLREAALKAVRVYPYDYRACLRRRGKLGKSCRHCAAIQELAMAAKAVKS